MKISKMKFILVSFLIASLLGIYVTYKVFYEQQPSTIPEIKESITSSDINTEEWNTSTWRVEVPPSYAKIENGIFKAVACQSSQDFFGASLIQQGDSPHGWWNTTAKLRKEITIYKDEEQLLILNFSGKRTSQIKWFTNDTQKRANNIGILLVGDFGQGYYDPDTSKPRALFIDIWLDTNPEVDAPNHWPGVENVENDYHSGFPAQTMPEVGKEYEFKFRIDPFIKESLRHWDLERFTLKMVQCYIEAKASNASIEVSRILIGTPEGCNL